jgi:hypothetical protein
LYYNGRHKAKQKSKIEKRATMTQRTQNEHHFNWERRKCDRISLLKKLRNHRGFIIPMDIYDHRALHREIRPNFPILRKNADIVQGLLERIGTYDSQAERLDYVNFAINYLDEREPRLAEHYREQREFVLLKPVTAAERSLAEELHTYPESFARPKLIVPPGIGEIAVASF